MTIQVTKCPPRAAKGAMRLEGAIGGARRGRPATIPVNGRRPRAAVAPAILEAVANGGVLTVKLAEAFR